VRPREYVNAAGNSYSDNRYCQCGQPREMALPGYRGRRVMAAADLFDHLQDAGYEPRERDALSQPFGGSAEDWYDLSGPAGVRVRVVTNDGDVAVHAFGDHEIVNWSARFTAGTPDAVIIAALAAAESEGA
jgi:hypothetical protein